MHIVIYDIGQTILPKGVFKTIDSRIEGLYSTVYDSPNPMPPPASAVTSAVASTAGGGIHYNDMEVCVRKL